VKVVALVGVPSVLVSESKVTGGAFALLAFEVGDQVAVELVFQRAWRDRGRLGEAG
jgi:hypothetical protein